MTLNSSVASFLVWGEAPPPPQMYRQKKKTCICKLYARAPQKHYVQILKYICIHNQWSNGSLLLLVVWR